MIDFWLPAALLMTVATAFVLLPLLRYTRASDGSDRSGENVAMYQEQLRALQGQHRAGLLSAAQLAEAATEASRSLLGDVGHAKHDVRASKSGVAWILAAALMVPLGGAAMYLHWGALDDVLQARQWASHAQNIGQLTQRLEGSLATRQDSPEAWFFLGRTYMAQSRHLEAAHAFERAATLAGRPAELLGQWAQARYFAEGQQWSAELQALTDEALALDPGETTSLTLAGMAAFERAHYADAAAYWERLAATLPDNDPGKRTIIEAIARARALDTLPAGAGHDPP